MSLETEKTFELTGNQCVIAFMALDRAWVQGLSFSVRGFCEACKAPENRHTRKVLNTLVKNGRLTAHRTLFDDGHYRMVYSAQHSRSMWS